MGTKIGRRVYLNTTHLTEYDLVEIGDGASLNDDCTLQTHLFEDRVMKMSAVHIDSRCVVGSQAILLPGAHMEEGSVMGELSLVMKGETLPAWSGWVGSPATATNPARRRHGT
jgi:non-ribosomal peptide synthetase-like protein